MSVSLKNFLWFALGLSITILMQFDMYTAALKGGGHIFVIMLLAVGPLALGSVAVLTWYLEIKADTVQPFSWFINGLSVGYFAFGGWVLVMWYTMPENSHLEPLFITISVGFATLQWCQSKWNKYSSICQNLN